MSDGAPPARQCAMCEREAVDPSRPGALCSRHHEQLDAGEKDATPAPEGGSPGSNPTLDAEETAALPEAPAVEPDTYPESITSREWWVAWILDGVERKRPVAPWQTGHAYPVEWRGDLPADERPEVDFQTAQKWTDFSLDELGLSLPEDAKSDELRLGIILPVDRPPRDERVVLIDWDDVRDPETGTIHPVAAKTIDEYGGYVEVSRSGEGLHQYVFGGLRHRDKFIAPIDDEPFVGEDLPQVEIYDGGRHVAMTGEHLEGTDRDLVDGQECIDSVVSEFAEAELDAGYRTYDPETGATPSDADRESGDDSPQSPVPEPDGCDYDGPPVEDLRESCPPDRSLGYHAVVEAFCEGYAGVLNWRLEGAAAALGQREGRTIEEIISDLRGEERDGGSKGYDKKTPGRVKYDYERANRDEFAPASWETLASWGVLPEAFVERVTKESGADAEHTPVLPDREDLQTATSGWDWRHAGEQPDRELTIDDARERTVEAIADAYDRHEDVLIEALPTMGKSYGAVKAAAETDTPITVLTGRGRKEQYEQFQEWCEEHGLSYYTLPAFTRDCDTANGEHGQEWADTVRDWYRRGATPKEIHKSAEYVLDRPLPCQEHEGQRCAYASKWDFDPDDFDVLIGHYAHAHKSKVTSGRTVVFDEFPDAYETTLGGRLQGAVSYWLSTVDAIPFEDFTDLIEHRDDERRRGEALLWFEEHDLEPDETQVFDDPSAHASAPLAVFTLLASEDLGNGFETADLDETGTGVYDRASTQVSLLQPPALEYASGVIALDGTPTKEMWELSLGTRLKHRPVLDEHERVAYVEDALNLNLVRTTDAVKPYNTADYVNVEQDAALLEAIAEQHDTQPSLITTVTAEGEYDAADALQHVDETKHYGNVLGSNEFDDTRVGAVIGSNHYGDQYIKKWGAFAGQPVERNDERGPGLSYGRFGDKVLTHMREHDTLQAAMRFGRDGNGAVVYVHTDTLPDWVPLAGEGRVVTTWSDGMRDVLDALADLDVATTAEIVAHPAVDVGRRQVFDHLETLRERGVLAREQDPEDGRRVRWVDDGVHRVGEHGEVELEPVELDALTDEEVAELARSTYYTCEFRNSPADDGPGEGVATNEPPVAADGGDRATHDAG